MDSRKPTQPDIRPLTEGDLREVVELQFRSWHEYYRQYPVLYNTIKNSVTEASLLEGWQVFTGQRSAGEARMVIGDERRAYVAVLDGEIVGAGGVSSYVEGKWPVVDELLRRADGELRKTAKFQELYIKPEIRRHGIGRQLSIARADTMLNSGYESLFLTTYAEAEKTNDYHLKNGLKKVHEYMSMEQFEGGARVKIACFLHLDLLEYRNRLQAKL